MTAELIVRQIATPDLDARERAASERLPFVLLPATDLYEPERM